MKNTLLFLLLSIPLLYSCDISGMKDMIAEIKDQNSLLSSEISRLQTKTDSLLNKLNQSM